IEDRRFNYGEARFIAYGPIDGRLHVLWFTMRGQRVAGDRAEAGKSAGKDQVWPIALKSSPTYHEKIGPRSTFRKPLMRSSRRRGRSRRLFRRSTNHGRKWVAHRSRRRRSISGSG